MKGKTDPFLLRAIAKATIVLCYQRHKPLDVHVSLWTTAAGLPITATNWRRLCHLKFITWNEQGWQLTPAGACLLRANSVKFPGQLVSKDSR